MAYRQMPLIVALLSCVGALHGQTTLPPIQVPVPSDGPQPGIIGGLPTATPPPTYQPPPPINCPPPPPPPLPPGAPLFMPPPTGSCWDEGEFFTSADVFATRPYVSNNLTATVTRNNGTTFQFSAPSKSLDWTLSPYLEVGYRLPQSGSAEFAVGYGLLNSDGSGSVAFNGKTFDVKSRLAVNYFNLDFGGSRVEVEPRWDFCWRLGVRTATVFYDTLASNAAQQDHESNYFVGAGPHGMLELRRQFTILPSFYLFGRTDGSVMVGQITQKFTEEFSNPMNPATAAFEVNKTQSIPTLNAQAGLTWAIPDTTFRISVGYEWEKWWSVGRLNDSRMNLTNNGPFLRGAFDF